jgi:hypothetical protein
VPTTLLVSLIPFVDHSSRGAERIAAWRGGRRFCTNVSIDADRGIPLVAPALATAVAMKRSSPRGPGHDSFPSIPIVPALPDRRIAPWHFPDSDVLAVNSVTREWLVLPVALCVPAAPSSRGHPQRLVSTADETEPAVCLANFDRPLDRERIALKRRKGVRRHREVELVVTHLPVNRLPVRAHIVPCRYVSMSSGGVVRSSDTESVVDVPLSANERDLDRLPVRVRLNRQRCTHILSATHNLPGVRLF